MHIGYSIDWKQVIVITWGGLRGAVGLSLALVVLQTSGIPLDTIGSKVHQLSCMFQITIVIVRMNPCRLAVGVSVYHVSYM